MYGETSFMRQLTYIGTVALLNIRRDSSRKRGKTAPKGHTLFHDISDAKNEGTTLNHKKPVLSEHLSFLSVRYNVFLAELFEAIVSARKKGKSTCTNLKIEYRGTIEGEAIFLITKEAKVVTQFRAAEELLLRKNIAFESWMDTDKIRKQIARQNKAPGLSTQIQDLRHGMKKVNVAAQVLETPKPSLVHTRYGNSAIVSNAWIADETGKVKLCLWNEQTNSIAVGNIIQIKNASVSTYKGERQLRLGKTATVSVLQDSSAEAKQQREAIAKSTIYA
jgi:replication factor A1